MPEAGVNIAEDYGGVGEGRERILDIERGEGGGEVDA